MKIFELLVKLCLLLHTHTYHSEKKISQNTQTFKASGEAEIQQENSDVMKMDMVHILISFIAKFYKSFCKLYEKSESVNQPINSKTFHTSISIQL